MSRSPRQTNGSRDEEVGMRRDGTPIMYACPKGRRPLRTMRSKWRQTVCCTEARISVAITVLESWWSSGDECEYRALKHEAAFRKKKGAAPVASDSNLADRMQRSSNLLAMFYGVEQGRLLARVSDRRWSTPVHCLKRSIGVMMH